MLCHRHLDMLLCCSYAIYASTLALSLVRYYACQYVCCFVLRETQPQTNLIAALATVVSVHYHQKPPYFSVFAFKHTHSKSTLVNNSRLPCHLCISGHAVLTSRFDYEHKNDSSLLVTARLRAVK